MLNLEKTSGLPITLQEDYLLEFGGRLSPVKPAIREFATLKNYLKNPNSSYWRRDVYQMYRDICLPEHRDRFRDFGLEYDLTVIPPGKIGDEFVKTIGHYHPKKPKTAARYPEVYEVISGKVFLLLQSASDDLDRLLAVYLVTAERGEKILVPPNFGHVSINPTDEVLVLANWQPLGNKGIYDPYEIHNGAAYYVIASERLNKSGQTSKNYDFVANLTYKSIPPLLQVRPRELPQYELRFSLPMYFTVSKNPEALDFLVNPENYIDELVPEKLFR